MAHEVENIMYVSNEENGRFVPWHGLGTAVAEAPTSADAIKLAGLDWVVESKPVFTDSGIEIPNYKANIRDIDQKVLGVVSNRYQVVQNKDAFDFTDALIGEGCKYETAGSICGGKRIFLLARMPESKILDDSFENYICFTNSHDGFSSIKAVMTPVRVVCQNTLSLALSSAKRQWSTKHIGNLDSKLAEARHTLELANDYMTEFGKAADILAHTKVTDAEVEAILDELFPVKEEDSDRRKRNIQEVKDQFMVCMLAPDILKFKGTAWSAVNAASDWATHTAPKRMTDNYQENNFNRVLDGHIVIDTFFQKLMEKATNKVIV